MCIVPSLQSRSSMLLKVPLDHHRYGYRTRPPCLGTGSGSFRYVNVQCDHTALMVHVEILVYQCPCLIMR